MSCFWYTEYDHDTDLVMLTATDGRGRYWTTVLSWEDHCQIQDRIASDEWQHTDAPLDIEQLREIVITVSGNDPCAG
jgi:hypothetical protein